MKIEFRTIEIVNLVLCYVATFGSLLAFNYLFDLYVPAIFFLLLPVLLYFLFRGKVEIAISEKELNVFWLKKPFPGIVENRTIDLTRIIRWKYEHTFRGPDKFTLILESGEKIKLCPDLFTFKEVETPLLKTLEEKISEANKGIPREVLLEKIRDSDYLRDLERKIKSIKGLLIAALFLGGVSLISGAFFPQSRVIWISFLISFCCCILFFLWRKYLKSERNKTVDIN